ncbi:Gfo/Idh/MocA family oxidoreductase [Mucilaginibacter sp. RB4R14]|uniref:Gfo/Idh/MocA family protein n=1 Tax=Mucilaginibacter aurantiaciroseus TaxID=2949308 RepID=UPI00209042CF|nr:Gfo/Idh/MocA family oxidoreductase [Mucilaginibacter aurantiaciroseus]MCO5936949.1 Gfo/Idh/MocA family oxidoreductase [Mucilaginibacter aurantiaciroseus]
MSTDRRKFLKHLGTSVLLTSASLTSLAAKEENEVRILRDEKRVTPNDKIRIATIGMGIMGFNDTNAALSVPGVEMVAACDLYKGRLAHAKEVYGKNLFTTMDHREILERKDIDAVIIATSDNWHSQIAIDAMKKGKAVYSEKPMIHKISQGLEEIRVQKETKMVFQVGSQRVSSIAYRKAKEMYESGAIGKINSIEASFNRQSALGAWQYTIPTDGNIQNVDWARYQSNASVKHDFDKNRFFRWRNYREYGTGVAGDLFVHLLSGIHFITGSKGPESIYSIGDLDYWKDGRNVPDVMSAIVRYGETKEHPAFQVTLRVNFISGEGDKTITKIVGSEGVMDIGGEGEAFTIHQNKMPDAPGIGGWDSLSTYTESEQKALMDDYNIRWTKAQQTTPQFQPINYRAPDGYNASNDHFANFMESVRTGKPVVEDAVFGFRAAAPALACNDSYFENKLIHWDAENMKIVG